MRRILVAAAFAVALLGGPAVHAAAFAPPSPAQWHALAVCESQMHLTATNGTDWGLYQFADGTWFTTTHLPGHASAYPLLTQLAGAVLLYQADGTGPWPHCGWHLRA